MKRILLKGLKAVLEEAPLNDPKLTRQRIETCKTCPSFNKAKEKCRICGCYVEIKAEMLTNFNPKKGMRAEKTHCPLALWPDTEKAVVNFYRRLDGEPLLK